MATTPKKDQQLKFACPFICPCPEGATASAVVATPNICVVSLDKLAETRPAATGDPTFCAKCRAVLSKQDASRMKKGSGASEWSWACQFCGSQNAFKGEPEEIPADRIVEYILERPAAAGSSAADESAVVFCVDVSGSMCVTSEVRKEGRSRYMSRLAAVQQAVTAQIADMARSQPTRRAALVTFSDDVEIVGDASGSPEVVAGGKLSDWDALLAIGHGRALDVPVERSKKALTEAVAKLEEKGATALGPALVISVAMASRRRGSKVVICTDGLSNVGLGAIEGAEDALAAAAFYEKVGQVAKEAGVSVGVVGIKGSKCSLENLGHVSDLTGGDVAMVDPVNLSFKDALSKPILATAVSVRVFVHPSLSLGAGAWTRSEDVGNADESSAVTFDVFTATAKEPPSEILVQAQISFTRLDGTRCLRVITTSIPFIKDVTAATRDIDVLAAGLHVSKRSARLVQDGKYDAARRYAQEWRTILERAVHTPLQREHMKMFLQQLREGEGALDSAIATEREMGMELGDDAGRFRGAFRSDITAERMYAMKSSKAAGCAVM